MKLRPSLLAGQWYPSDKEECISVIKSWEKGKKISSAKGGVVPHAGWFFSGEVSSMVMESLSGSNPDLVILFGMHLGEDHPVYFMTKGGYQTPLGPVPIMESVAEKMGGKFDFINETHDSFTPDNTIEVQLPIIKYFMPEAKILAAGIPPSEYGLGFARALFEDALKETKNIVVIGSTDLTHYGPSYGFTPVGTGEDSLEWVKNVNDKRMIDLFLKMDGEGIRKEAFLSHNACCPGAASAAVEILSKRAESASLLKYSTSHEKSSGPSFVGYAGILFE